jgi:hypothetical protein
MWGYLSYALEHQGCGWADQKAIFPLTRCTESGKYERGKTYHMKKGVERGPAPNKPIRFDLLKVLKNSKLILIENFKN